MLQKFQPNSRFPQILNNIEIFENIDRNQNFIIFVAQSAFFEKKFEQNRYFSTILTKIEIFQKFRPKLRLIKKIDQKQDFR